MSDRKKEIEKAANEYCDNIMLATWFRDGAIWADSHPDIDTTSKFTANLIEENREQFKKLNKVTAVLEKAKKMAEFYANYIPYHMASGPGKKANEWLKEYETVMKREGGEK